MRLKTVLIVAAAVVGVAAPAAAFVVPVIDVGPEQAIWQNQLVQQIVSAGREVQSVVNQGLQLKNEAQNLSSMRNIVRQPIQQNLARILAAAPPQTVGDKAADQVLTQEPDDAQNVSQIDARAAAANGAQQQAQVESTYLSAIANEQIKANALAAEQQEQQKNKDTAEVHGLSDLFSGALPDGELP